MGNVGGIGSFFNPIDPLAAGTLPANQFQGQTAGAGAGTDQLNEQDYGKLINSAIANQSGLVGQLQAQANGIGGPNLAQQQLANATNQNIQSQAGAVAGLRGLNPAMAARLIAGQGAAIQQGAAGQSATLAMQQQLAAQQQLGGILGQQLGVGTQGLQGQNALNLQNQQGAQQLDQKTAAQNADLKLQANGQSLGLTQQGGKTLGGVVNAAGSIAAGMPPMGGDGGGGPEFNHPNGDGTSTINAAHGGQVAGQRAFPGDDTRNDTKPFLLSPGELVVPASIADDPEAVAAFTAAIKRHKKASKKAG